MKASVDISAVPGRGDRRRSARLAAQGEILGVEVATGTPVRVIDLSFGGFLLETASPFEVGSLHQFEFAAADGSVDVVITGVVIHSRRDSLAAVRSTYITGFSLAGPHHWDTQARFDRLLDTIARRPEFE